MNQYPEHLNPFAEATKKKHKTLNIASFRGLKNTLRRSFRGKSRTDADDGVEIRNKQRPVYLPVNDAPERFSLPQPLPRSRFQDRLRQTYNPFDDQERGDQNEDLVTPKPRMRRKKRAPMPPNKSLSNQDVSNETDTEIPSSSQWSLNSEIESSYADDNPEDVERTSLRVNFSEFNKEMEKLNDDTNNNTTFAGNIPDVIISCPDNEKEQTDSEDIPQVLDKPTETECSTTGTSDVELVKEQLENIHIESDNNAITATETVNIQELVSESSNINETETNINANSAKTEENTSTEPEMVRNLAVQEELSSDSDSSDNEELVVKDITHNLLVSDDVSKNDIILNNIDNDGSLTDSKEMSKEQIDACNNNNEPFNKNGLKYVDEEEETDAPQPKQRKNKPSRNNLLGI